MNTFNSSSISLASLASTDNIEIQGAEHRASILSETTPHATLSHLLHTHPKLLFFSFPIVLYFFLNSIYFMTCIIFHWPELFFLHQVRSGSPWSKRKGPMIMIPIPSSNLQASRTTICALRCCGKYSIKASCFLYFLFLLESGPGPVATSVLNSIKRAGTKRSDFFHITPLPL